MSDQEKEIAKLKKEKEALLSLIPAPRPSSSERPVVYEKSERVTLDGSRVTLEWEESKGWQIDIKE